MNFCFRMQPHVVLNDKLLKEAILETGRCVFGIQTKRQHSCWGSVSSFQHLWPENIKETWLLGNVIKHNLTIHP